MSSSSPATAISVLPRSLPERIAEEIRRLVEKSLKDGGHSELATLVHGTTVGSNTILEGKGAITGLLTTLRRSSMRGFRDELEIRRMARPPVFDFLWERPPPLILRRRRIEVTERGEVARTPISRQS